MPFLPSHVVVGSDHAGYELKQALVPLLIERGFEIEDLSPELTAGDDYPLIARQVATRVSTDPAGVWGVALCGSGIGVSIEANRHRGVRAALVRSSEDAKLARQHNHANVLALGGGNTSTDQLSALLDAWIDTEPSTEERHVRRTAELDRS